MSNTSFVPFESDDNTAYRLIGSIEITDLVSDEEIEEVLGGTATVAENAAAFVRAYPNIASAPDTDDYRYAGG